MRSVRFYGVGDVRFEETAKPDLGENEVLIKILYGGICGSDLHIYNKAMFVENIPSTMGHEFVGIIEKGGYGFEGGDMVVGNPMVPCQRCNSCKAESYNTCESLGFIGEVSQGCFAEYLAMDYRKLIRVPKCENVKEVVLSEPLAVAVNICERANFKKGDKLLVTGAGPIGLLTIALAKKIYGVEDITALDLSESRLEMAKVAGANCVVKSIEDTHCDFDIAVEAAGVEITTNNSLKALKANGRLFVVSIFEKAVVMDINMVVSKQISVVGCNVYEHRQLIEAVNMIATNKIDIGFLITHMCEMEDCKNAFELLANRDKNAAKVIFKI